MSISIFYIISLVELILLLILLYIDSILNKEINFISIRELLIGIIAFSVPFFNMLFFFVAIIDCFSCIFRYLKEYNIIPINKWLNKLKTYCDKDIIRIGKNKK
jgi:hypothetical protein